ncbi:MAG: YsnF/AvaK domain-containing protein [Bacillota bacterium]|nr:YsnF/AvaK domain-containing protein [Bacillota bacterium]
MENGFELKKEQLDIINNFISHGKVVIHRDTYLKDEMFTLPVQYEDLVIERETNGKMETLRLPISTEVYDHMKKKKILYDVDVYKSILTETQHIPIDLKKEEMRVEYNTDKISFT